MNGLIFEDQSFTPGQMLHIEAKYLHNYPIVYILYNEKKRPAAYIGQTVQASRRLKNHLEDKRRTGLNRSILIGHEQFNQSATYNIESNLINFFIADNQYQLQNVSQTRMRVMHDYYEKKRYNEEIFPAIWEKLRAENIVSDTIENLKNKDIYKLSPYKELSAQQLEIKNEILEFCRKYANQDGHHVIAIEGDAGTGKSVLLSSLFNTIQDLAKDPGSDLAGTDNYLLVNHTEMLKTYKSIANSLPNLKKKNLMKPTPFINQKEKTGDKADIVLIDEAHLLLTKEDAYNNFRHDNQLDEIIKRSRIAIVIFDPNQVLKIKSYWDGSLLDEVTSRYHATTKKLSEQMRMEANQDTLQWIQQFVRKKIMPLPKRDPHFEFELFDDPEQFKAAIEEKNEEKGLSRIVSTFDYLHKKDGNTYYVDKDGLNMPWNQTQDSITWAENPDSIREVGSIYTVQGFDLNYVGVVLGPSISYDEERDELVIDPSHYKDTGAFISRPDLSQEKNQEIKEEIILNSINVLMKRGIHGLYLYATDPTLQKRLQQLKGDTNHE
ncbi:Endonuclease [Bacillus sp. 349Y]|nr:Endonuclease [Bacillus sp. 349Y]